MGRRGVRYALFVVGAALSLAAACTPPATGGTGSAAPVAVLSALPTSGPAPLTVHFDMTASHDDVAITSFSWDFGDGSPIDTANEVVDHVYEDSGTYTAKLTVKDSGNRTGTATKVISVGVTPDQPPTAVLVADPTEGVAPLVVSFTGSGSTDAEGPIASYSWDFGDEVGTSTEADPSYTYTAAGTYAVSLTVTDANGADHTATETIEVATNQSPTAVVGANVLVGREPLTVNFSSGGSNDPDGTIASYSWNFGDNSPNSSAPNPSHTYATFGSYTATLTVTDDKGATESNSVVITVNANQAPVAVANSSVAGGQVPLTVNFTGDTSVDPDGTIVSHRWAFGDGTFANTANASHTYGTSGPFLATLTVTDDNGAVGQATLTIEVSPIPNVPPVAVLSCSPASGKQPLLVSCNSTGSTDSDGTIVSRHWDFGDGYTVNTASASHAIAAPGNFVVTLTVTDNAGAQSTDTFAVTVNANQPPTAAASGAPLSGKESLVVNFSSAGSSDPDGTFTTHWDFDDGGTSTAANPSHTYTSAGTYDAVLTVTDDNGVSDTKTVTIIVNANQAPTAALNATPQSGRQTLSVDFSSASSVDPDGTIVSRQWNFGDGGTSTAANPSHGYAAGTYTATLTITDDNGAQDTKSVSISVWVDGDGDGFRPPATPNNGPGPYDCDDTVASVNPGAADSLDAAGADTNCDGYDGVAANTYFVSKLGSDVAGCGPIASPCLTVGTGVTRANAAGKTVLQVGAGAYAESFTITPPTGGLTIRGGYDSPGGSNDFKSRAGTTTVNGTTGSAAITAGGSANAITLLDLTVNGPTGASPTGILVNGASNVTLQRVTVNSGTNNAAAGSTYGVRAISGATVTILDSTVTSAAAGAANASTAHGAAGAATCDGLAGKNYNDSQNDGAASCGGTAGSTRSGAGGKGAQGNNNGSGGSVGGAGAAGGAGGEGDCTFWAYGGDGGTGGSATAGGAAGAKGTNGTGSAGSTWVGVSGGTGGTGGSGGGGGGGGGGGATCAGTWAGGGGSGGGGGTGGSGGGGGAAGGGSFAVYNSSSTVTVTNSVLTAGAGGAGGKGGTGGAGGAGGSGGRGGNANTALQAGAGGGGGGGAGGSGGGGGGGGAGGPSIAAFHVGSGSLTVTSTTSNRAGTAAAGGASGNAGGSGGGGVRGELGNSSNQGSQNLATAGASGNGGATGTAGDAGLLCSKYTGGVCTP